MLVPEKNKKNKKDNQEELSSLAEDSVNMDKAKNQEKVTETGIQLAQNSPEKSLATITELNTNVNCRNEEVPNLRNMTLEEKIVVHLMKLHAKMSRICSRKLRQEGLNKMIT